MGKNGFSWDVFWKFPAVGIMRGFETDLAVEIATESFKAGLTSIEVTLNTADALNQIRAIKKVAPDGVHVGAGTVISIEGLEGAIEAGAEFIVCPNTNVEIIKRAVEADVPIFPGALTPSEVVSAWDAGAKAIKLFPVGIGGPKYLKSVKAPLDHIPLIAVDGVNLENIREYLFAGASGVGVGSQFFQMDRMLAKDWSWLHRQIKAYIEVFENINP